MKFIANNDGGGGENRISLSLRIRECYTITRAVAHTLLMACGQESCVQRVMHNHYHVNTLT
jgi:hypothetical protein